MDGRLEDLWSGCSAGACWAVGARQLRIDGPEQCPASSLKLSAAAESSTDLRSFTVGICPRPLPARFLPQLGVAAGPLLFPSVGWLKGLKCSALSSAPHSRGLDDPQDRRTSGETSSLHGSSIKEIVARKGGSLSWPLGCKFPFL